MFELKDFLRNKGMDVSNIDEMTIRSDASILNMILKDNPSRFPYSIFDADAWTDENMYLYFKNVKNIYSLLSIFRTSKVMLIALNCNRVDILSLFTADLINDEVENKYVEKCEQGLINFIINTFCTSNILIKLLNKNLLHHASLMAKNSSIWTDDCVNLFCQKLDSYQGSLESVDIMYLSQLHNNKIIYALLKNKYYDIVRYIEENPSLLDSICEQLLIDNIDDYFKFKNNIPEFLRNSEAALKKVLKNGTKIHGSYFSEEAWTEENMYLYFNNQANKSVFDSLKNSKGLWIALDCNRFDLLILFDAKDLNNQVIDKIVEKMGSGLLDKIPSFLQRPELLDKLIANNLLNHASRFISSNWTTNNINSFCKMLDNYQGSLDVIMAIA